MLPKPESPELEELLVAAEELRSVEKRLNAVRASVSAKARGLSRIKDKRRRIEAAFYAYWMVPEATPTDLALAATGRPHPGKLLRLGGAVTAGFRCGRCDDELPIRSRNQMKDMLDRARRGGLNDQLLCVPCQDEMATAQWRRSDAEHAAQLARTAELQALPYEEYLRSSDWLGQRDFFLTCMLSSYSPLMCEVCNVDANLGIYHRSLDRLGAGDDLILLCSKCLAPLASAGQIAGTPCDLSHLSASEVAAYSAALRNDLGVT